MELQAQLEQLHQQLAAAEGARQAAASDALVYEAQAMSAAAAAAAGSDADGRLAEAQAALALAVARLQSSEQTITQQDDLIALLQSKLR